MISINNFCNIHNESKLQVDSQIHLLYTTVHRIKYICKKCDDEKLIKKTFCKFHNETKELEIQIIKSEKRKTYEKRIYVCQKCKLDNQLFCGICSSKYLPINKEKHEKCKTHIESIQRILNCLNDIIDNVCYELNE